MNEEEKKAIDNFKRLDFFDYDWQIGDNDFETRDEMLEYAEKMQKIILNVIDKQQKEIEKLKQIDRHITKEIIEFVNSHYISKGEIEEKIKEYQEKAEDVKQKYRGGYAYISDYLEALAKIEGYQELLEEK